MNKNIATDKQGSLVFYKSEDGNIQLNVKLEKDTVWLTQSQMSNLFGVDRTVIVRHIRNIYKSAELCENATCAKNAQVQEEGGRTVRRTIPYYNLDMIISVGYRVNSKNATQFRIWATSILKQYLIKGYAINDQRLQQLGEVIRIMKRTQNELDAKQVLSVVENYNTALSLLDDYDHQCMKRPEGSKATYVLSYEECRNLINQMRFNADSDLFGHEKDDSFKGSIGNIYQSFGGEDVYPTLEEKAANLLYFVTKNHSFSDGNKRIAATIFLYFLDKNGILYDENGNKRIADYTLVALTIMIAESRIEEKEMMVSIIMNCI
ncbi:virulence protein RhuM/Fic/DOC family protein [uncultured Bacteroides sp.]|uniref:virulence protein RhuM/Fic/DOC family protein n=1 Tax=uncultured Bacteroides sp. TaxID=162156 RepID=UPI002632DBCC|nr:virulence protein RhuM/Fic/DOC family protein [uncultured Bacteroides sp.]